MENKLVPFRTDDFEFAYKYLSIEVPTLVVVLGSTVEYTVDQTIINHIYRIPVTEPQELNKVIEKIFKPEFKISFECYKEKS